MRRLPMFLLAVLIPCTVNLSTDRGAPMPRRWTVTLQPAVAAAQTPAPTVTDFEARRSRMRTFLVLRISEALNLPEEKALQISKVLRDAEDKRRTLVSQRREVEHNLQAAVDGQKPDQAALTKLIAQANEIDGQIAMIPENSFRQAQGLLTVEQQARLVLLRPELQAQIRRNVERRMQGARMPPK
jgi:hypothetical protein